MSTFKKIVYFLDSSNLNISFSGAVLTYGIVTHFLMEHAIEYGAIVFFLTFSIYNLQRLVDKRGFALIEPPLWGKYSFLSITLSIISLLIALIIGLKLFYFNWMLFLLSLAFAFICMWYTTPVFGLKLREIPGFKIVITALTWGYASAFFPLVNEGLFIGTSGLFMLLIYIYFVAIIIPFDIRDMPIDNLKNSTLPQLLGVVNSKLVGIAFLLIFIIGNLYLGFIEPDNLLFYMAVVIQLLFLLFANHQRPFYYFTLIDFSIVLLGISYLN